MKEADIESFYFNMYDVYKLLALRLPKILCNYMSINFKLVRPSSIAKAHSSLINPSIITSTHYRSIHRPSLRLSGLSIPKLELRLREISRSTQLLPARVSTNLINFYFNHYLNRYPNHYLKSSSIKFNTNQSLTNQSNPSKILNTFNQNVNVVLKGNFLFEYWSVTNKIKVTITLKSHYTNNLDVAKNFYAANYIKDGSKWMIKLLIRSGDVELNPGPKEMTLVTLNCRGLKNEEKLKQLLHRFTKSHDIYSGLIIALQESHLDYDTFKYRWKGRHIFTPSDGAKGGVITLLSDGISITKEIHIGHEAHIALLKIIHGQTVSNIIVTNLHSPCAHNRHKLKFFEDIKSGINELLSVESESKIIIMGDFNTTFNKGEHINTSWSRSEQIIAKKILNLFSDLYLKDCWSTISFNTNVMTWRHSDKMSRIDRIFVSENLDLSIKSIHMDWSYTTSDHGAVITKLSALGDNQRYNNKVVRLDTRFMQDTKLKHKFLTEIKRHVDQISEQNMNPHQQLEFLKMAIRSTALEIASNQKKEREAVTKEIRRDINFWQSTYEQSMTSSMRDNAMCNLEKAKTKLEGFLEETGRYLCCRSKSMWYQEGEKGSKYFLNLERSKSKLSEMDRLKKNGTITYDEKEIDKMVEGFYKSLYEKGDTMIKNKGQLNTFLSNIKEIDKSKNDIFNHPIMMLDLHKTLLTCKDSAPGPDGIPYSLIKLTWNYFGPLLINSWQYAIETGSLTHSHESSYLKLLPKEGKDHTELKNWRPITLSNCDFKIITKNIAMKMTEALSNSINPTQTAYIRGRQITDNLHIIQYMTEKISQSNKDRGILISLDAEKAFDSIEHWYIKAVLDKLGLGWFKNIFELLYKNQKVSILNNKRNAGAYVIKNGVKQGDALSCILFIMGIEPLLKNIESDRSIDPIIIGGNILPKTVSYADDVACITTPTLQNVNKIFKHYEQMTKLSGLKLNADKTEIISKNGLDVYDIRYNDKSYQVVPSEIIKVNGLFLSFQYEQAALRNINKIYESVEGQFKMWSHRHLSVLGKIQIFKTFGLSQILFVGSTVSLPKKEENKLTNLIYKFIWTKDMDGNKAPDRIKRSILKIPMKDLGFGMIDFREVLRSIRIKTVLRLMNSPNHPLHDIINNATNNSIYLNLRSDSIRPCIDNAIQDINKIWKDFVLTCPSTHTQDLLNLIGNEYVGNVTIKKYRNKRLGLLHRHDKIRDIMIVNTSHPMLKKLEHSLYNFINTNKELSVRVDNNKWHDLVPINGILKQSTEVSSKDLRASMLRKPIITYKSLKNPTQEKIKSLGIKLSRITNVRLKSILLRSIHGDIYSKTRLKKFGMIECDKCPRCNEPETVEHLLLRCSYCTTLWALVSSITGIPIQEMDELLGLDDTHDTVTLTIHTELIRKLLAIERPICNPTKLLKTTLENLALLEKGITKYQINLLLKQIT